MFLKGATRGLRDRKAGKEKLNEDMPKYFKFLCVCVRVYLYPEISSFFGEFPLSFPSY